MQRVVAGLQAGEVAEILQCDRRTVHRLREQGVLPAITKRPGPRGAYKWDPEVVEQVRKQRAAQLAQRLEAMGGAA